MPQRSAVLSPTTNLTGGRTLLHLATAGSVDDGKSTLVGRLLFDTNSVLADALDHVEQVSRRRGLDRTDLALLTDGLRAEREQGITIDVAYRYFATPRGSSSSPIAQATCSTPEHGDGFFLRT
jgi:sulfate adenylyltransferase subunit 1